jgi:aconitate hydratase
LRSNPLKLAEFALSRKDPAYVGLAKSAQSLEIERVNGKISEKLAGLLALTADVNASKTTGIGSTIFAVKPGDGSAREQAASSQKMLGGEANIAIEYATKRYRSNLINWGMLPFLINPADLPKLEVGDWLHIPGIREAVKNAKTEISAYLIKPDGAQKTDISLKLPDLTKEDRDIILAGCLMNYYAHEE